MNSPQPFDYYAETYDDDLNQALALTGEDKKYYAECRVRWLLRRLQHFREKPRSILDYGCGIGDTTVLLRNAFTAQAALGLDVSERSLEVARARNHDPNCQFMSFFQHAPDGSVDLAYCNGVFHHIPVPARAAAAQYVYKCLRPGGWFAFWENNSWNPGTRYVMARIPFDRDAVTLSPPQAKQLLLDAGFEIVRTDYQFFFPRFLKVLRVMEPGLATIPLGAQYQVLGRKPIA